MTPVFLGRPLRTPIGRERGALRDREAYDLAAAVVRAQSAALNDGAGRIDRVILANVLAFGNVARVAALAAGLPPSVSALAINEQCSGGLAAVRLAVDAVRAGAPGFVAAGGTESASCAATSAGGAMPRAVHAPAGVPDPDMGPAADETARRLAITRAEQDDYAWASYDRTIAAREEGFFDAILVPVATPAGPVRTDETPRRRPDRDRLGRYPPAFGPSGTVTAGNAGAIGDGAAAVLVGAPASFAAAGVAPAGRVIATATAACDPATPALAIVPAIERALAAASVTAPEVEAWEINEAFAVKVVASIRHFNLDRRLVNANGGAIAYGHPFAASGAITLVHLLHRMQRSAARLGVAAIAGAGGVGEAMVIARD